MEIRPATKMVEVWTLAREALCCHAWDQPAAVARGDARHARDRGAGGDARRSSPSLSLARTRSGGAGAATLGVALPAWEQRRRRRLAQPAAAALAAMCRRR